MAWNDVPAERGLRDHLGVLRRQWLVIVAVTGVAVLVALVGVLRTPTQYQSSVEVSYPQQAVTITNLANDQLIDRKLLDPARATQNEARFATSDQIRAEVAQKVPDVPFSVSVRALKDADSLVLTASAPTPDEAKRLAQATADAYVAARRAAASDTTEATIDRQLQAIDELLTQAPAGAEGDRVRELLEQQRQAWVELRSTVATGGMPPTVLRAASTPAAPSSPRPVRSLVLAGIVGLLLGLLAAYAREGIDDRVDDLDELARASRAPVLGTTASGEPELRTAHLDDPAVRAATLLVPVEELATVGAPATAGSPPVVILVPRRTRGRAVRDALGVLDRLDLPVAGVLLAERTTRNGTAADAARSSTAS